jgi:hypothetical protein
MSKKSRQHRETNDVLSGLKLNDETSNSATPLASDSNQTGMFSSLKRHWLAVAVIAFVALGTLGAGLKYLDDDARRELAKRSASTPLNPVKDESMLNAVNPFLPASLPSPTPQLSKEYLYAGSRLLAVEDANANAAPPADLAIWRPSSGVWWVMGGTNSQQVGFAWGTNGDTPVPGDYDGDGKTDFSVFRPGNNTWYIFNSSTNALTALTFGQAGDKVAQADYDGDGRTDAAVFRDTGANLATWYVQGSSSGFYASQFGLASDAPAPADYDGDGKADIAVWRNSNKTFYSNNSSNNSLRTSSAFAQATTETPVSADYDGDGRADHAIRNSNNWLILKSTTNTFDTIAWQQQADKAVPNDYDGDGKVDIATWRDSNGDWYIRQSSRIGQTNELRQEHWGQAGDIPVPAFYRR